MKIGLIGNPNCGKSTLFNRLTGLRQKTSNLPGTTVEASKGIIKTGKESVELIDLPGIYSLFTQAEDEKLVVSHLLGINNPKPDGIIFVLDASNLRRNLLLVSQVLELGIPAACVLTMSDTAKRRSITIDASILSQILGIQVIEFNPRKDKNESLVIALLNQLNVGHKICSNEGFEDRLNLFFEGQKVRGLSEETLSRYATIEKIIKQVVVGKNKILQTNTLKIDTIVTHPIMGWIVFLLIIMSLFQGVFTLASIPMDLIEFSSGWFRQQFESILPNGLWSDFISNGLLSGIQGVIVFVPQIFILFFLIGLLEDSGYMVRASFLTDKIMRKIGLNGRSIIPLVGGFACAIPSIMATRSIKNKSERLLTMLLVPLMSCSARLPVYVLLISLAIPVSTFWGPFHAQTFIMTATYFSGIVVALIFAALMQVFGKKKEISEFVLELPVYQTPSLKTVSIQAWNKCKAFLSEAGKIIVIISIILWALSSFGPKEAMRNAQIQSKELAVKNNIDSAQALASLKLEASYAGHIGKIIEPVIKPLGYDWKTGIALISSFAAREVFVGTMSTLFQSNSDSDDVSNIREKMQTAINPNTGKPLYGLPYAISLLLFYAFALQCISTMAVIKKETGSWKWPISLFIIYGSVAYLSAFLAYNLLS